MRFIVVSVFSIYFLNYGVLYLVAPMQVELPGLDQATGGVKGIYKDFNMFWYSDIGKQIVSVMIINAIFPPIELAILWLLSMVLRGIDQRRCCRKLPPEETRKKTLFAYKNLYSGDEF